MISQNPLIQSELDYRRSSVRRDFAAHKGSRSRRSWVRRLVAADDTARKLAE